MSKLEELEKEWSKFREFAEEPLITGLGYFKYREGNSAFSKLKESLESDNPTLPEICIYPGRNQFSEDALIVWVGDKKLGWITQKYVKSFCRYMAKVSGQNADELNWGLLRSGSMLFFATKKTTFCDPAYRSQIDIAPVFWINDSPRWMPDHWYYSEDTKSVSYTQQSDSPQADLLKSQANTNFKERNQMSQIVSNVISSNTEAIKVAAYNEAARIVLNKATKVVSSQAPLMVRGYVETPFGKLVVANLFQYLIQNYRGKDARLLGLSQAMVANSYQEILQGFNLEKMLEELTSGINLPELATSKVSIPE